MDRHTHIWQRFWRGIFFTSLLLYAPKLKLAFSNTNFFVAFAFFSSPLKQILNVATQHSLSAVQATSWSAYRYSTYAVSAPKRRLLIKIRKQNIDLPS